MITKVNPVAGWGCGDAHSDQFDLQVLFSLCRGQHRR